MPKSEESKQLDQTEALVKHARFHQQRSAARLSSETEKTRTIQGFRQQAKPGEPAWLTGSKVVDPLKMAMCVERNLRSFFMTDVVVALQRGGCQQGKQSCISHKRD